MLNQLCVVFSGERKIERKMVLKTSFDRTNRRKVNRLLCERITSLTLSGGKWDYKTDDCVSAGKLLSTSSFRLSCKNAQKVQNMKKHLNYGIQFNNMKKWRFEQKFIISLLSLHFVTHHSIERVQKHYKCSGSVSYVRCVRCSAFANSTIVEPTQIDYALLFCLFVCLFWQTK